MAVGDIVNDLATVANGASLIFQPAVGVEVFIFNVAMGRSTGITMRSYDGTLSSDITIGSEVMIVGGAVKLGISNAHYLRIINQTTEQAGEFSGVVTLLP